MKPVYIVSWLFALAVSFVSCDDWLDKTPKDRLCIRMYISRLKMSCDYLRISFITIWFRPLSIFIPSRPI